MTKNDALLAKTKLFVLDMDGTFYLGNQILPGAAEFLRAVKAAGKDYLFFTNNSSRSPRRMSFFFWVTLRSMSSAPRF